ncbi:MAG: hypothetical protein K5666_02725 [Bacilli bacterium]|nr:hypothetical protein [Bacilli bacterium]
MKNTTYVHVMGTVLAEKDKYAKEFSEGNEYLEKALLHLWDKGLATTGCCAGHPVEETEHYIYNNNPTMTFCFDDNCEELIKLISSMNKKNIIDLSICVGAQLRTVSLNGVKEKTTEFFTDMCNDYTNVDENIRGLFSLALSTDLTGDYEIPSSIDVYIKYKDGEVDCIGISTIKNEIADKLKQHYECEEYTYCDQTYYSFKVNDYEFLRYLGISKNK